MEVEVLMKRMVELQQQQEEEECTQEEMVTRFERERSESIPTGVWVHFRRVARLGRPAALTFADSALRLSVQRWCEELHLTWCCVWWRSPSSDTRTSPPEESIRHLS